MKNIYLFQPQHSAEFDKKIAYWLPYAAGCVWSYARQFDHIKQNFDCKEIFFRKENPETVLARMKDPVLCGFSCYTWNRNYNLHLAELIKQRWPKCVIVFGGAEVNSEMFQYKFIDTFIMAEGERSFTKLLTDILEDKETDLLCQADRLTELEIPSPYLTGVFDSIIDQHPDALWSMCIETNRGCPYSCTFCDWGGGIYTKVRKFNLERVQAELEWMSTRPIDYLYCTDANFGMFKERDLQVARMIREYADRGQLRGFYVNYAKHSNEIVFEIAKILGPLSRGVTLSVQSMHEETLDAIKRKNLASNNIAHLLDLSEKYSVNTYTEAIIGLPQETLESWIQGMCDILEVGQHNSIDIYFTQLFPNNEMSQPESRKKYGIKGIVLKGGHHYYSEHDWNNVSEDAEIIQSTNTMSTMDIVDGYMYSWMIIQFHLAGYSQLFAKYCRFNKNISYRQFYNALYYSLQKNSGPVQDFFIKFKQLIHDYLETGEVSDPHNLGGKGKKINEFGFDFMYNNMQLVYQLIEDAIKPLTELDSSVVALQKNMVFDQTVDYPIYVDSKVNIKTWQSESCQYEIKSNDIVLEDFNFFRARRAGKIKNIFTKL
jgi:putative methyltransferase